MLPLKDNLPTERLPLVTLLLIAAGIVMHVVLRDDGGLLRLLANAFFLAIFGPSVEDSMSRPRFLAFCLLGAAAALAVQLALDPDETALVPVAATGAVAAVVAGYALLYRRARLVSVLLVPFAFTLVELPAWILLALWFAAQAAFGDWTAFAAQAGGFAVGLLAIGAFVQRRKQPPPPLSAPRAEAVS